ncbi:MAG TPA: hypothetical protein VLG11_01220 [Candidatus Saccharimonadales bacterium]|nr:hypothetical protein [Candidatus Saccharimonadales bacterium]
MSAPTILIASTSIDRPNYAEVMRQLEARGVKVIVYETDSIAKGSRQFNAHIDKQGVLQFTYDGQVLDPKQIDAAWYRKPMYYGQGNSWRWLSLKDEYEAGHNTLLQALPEDIWLNSWPKMDYAQAKIPQLAAAAACGFKVPETVVSNQWASVEALDYEQLSAKMARTSIVPSIDGKQEKIMHATKLTHAQLPKQVSPYPAIWQPFIEKKREWRVTVVGDKVFAAAIYTDDTAKDDWRKHQFTSAVQFKAEDFPKEEAEKCKALLKHYGLRYGAFDFIEKPDGEIVYLEVNPNGQFKWLEDDLGLPISEAIADELLRMAEDRKN